MSSTILQNGLTDQPIRYSLLTSFDRNDAGMLFIYCQIRKKSYPVPQKIEGNFESILLRHGLQAVFKILISTVKLVQEEA
jgi:hypothetical protein